MNGEIGRDSLQNSAKPSIARENASERRRAQAFAAANDEVRIRKRKIQSLLASALDDRLRVFMRNRDRKRATEKGIHDLRVASRRLIALVELLGSILPGDKERRVRKLLKSQLDALSSLRDVQVQIALLRNLAEQYPKVIGIISKLLSRERVLSRKVVKEFGRLNPAGLSLYVIEAKSKLSALLSNPAAELAAAIAMHGVLARLYLALFDLKIEFSSASVKNVRIIHDMRVAFKRFRYCVEILRPIYPAIDNATVSSMIEFQRAMGEIQDIDVLISGVKEYSRRLRRKKSAVTAAGDDSFDRIVSDLTVRQEENVSKFIGMLDRIDEFGQILI